MAEGWGAHQSGGLSDGDLCPEVADGAGDGLAVEPVRGVPYQSHSVWGRAVVRERERISAITLPVGSSIAIAVESYTR